MTRIWFAEDLMVSGVAAEEVSKAWEIANDNSRQELAKLLGISALELRFGRERAIAGALEARLRKAMRLHEPACRALTADERRQYMIPADRLAFLVRLGAEFDLSAVRDDRWQLTTAWYRSNLSAAGDVQPRVISVYPQRLYEGAQENVDVKLGVGLSLLGVPIGPEVGSNLQVGQVAPVMLGFHGAGEREPYWEVRRGPTSIEGTYNFWMVVSCGSTHPIAFQALVEADLQVHHWRIPVGPKKRAWQDRLRWEIGTASCLRG